jgi:hypothetical protein
MLKKAGPRHQSSTRAAAAVAAAHGVRSEGEGPPSLLTPVGIRTRFHSPTGEVPGGPGRSPTRSSRLGGGAQVWPCAAATTTLLRPRHTSGKSDSV